VAFPGGKAHVLGGDLRKRSGVSTFKKAAAARRTYGPWKTRGAAVSSTMMEKKCLWKGGDN